MRRMYGGRNSANSRILSTPLNPRVTVFDPSSLLGLSERDPLLEKRYVHYIQSPTRGQEPLDDHLADGWFKGRAF